MLVIAGLAIAALAVLLVLEPILRAALGQAVAAAPSLFDDDEPDDPVRRRRDTALAALREIEFDRATGKLSDEDYQALRTNYAAEAVEALDAAERAAGGAEAAPASRTAPLQQGTAAVVGAKTATGPSAPARRPRFCEQCGSGLPTACRFCEECGTRITP